MKTGLEQITEERVKQIKKYGYTPLPRRRV